VGVRCVTLGGELVYRYGLTRPSDKSQERAPRSCDGKPPEELKHREIRDLGLEKGPRRNCDCVDTVEQVRK